MIGMPNFFTLDGVLWGGFIEYGLLLFTYLASFKSPLVCDWLRESSQKASHVKKANGGRFAPINTTLYLAWSFIFISLFIIQRKVSFLLEKI